MRKALWQLAILAATMGVIVVLPEGLVYDAGKIVWVLLLGTFAYSWIFLKDVKPIGYVAVFFATSIMLGAFTGAFYGLVGLISLLPSINWEDAGTIVLIPINLFILGAFLYLGTMAIVGAVRRRFRQPS